ncbi:PH domain-containing protein [Longimicrobium sp.]|uniref:PH domain-containing protein n=1 Tax=Longimicrobium sp. TaxID=2029185 RepID=UPI002E33321C|nr:PH domain-containing protein [Longimicrobium sp.]HEX6039371.1 PH domain-containing protein [Longimicrobium sp.]
MSALSPILTWTFVEEIAVPAEIRALLIDGEEPVGAYRTIRDVATITNKRIIIADKQGLTGKKVEIYTIPFKSIVMYSTENAGSFLDFNAELELWTRAGHFKINLNKGIDIRKLDRLIASYIL